MSGHRSINCRPWPFIKSRRYARLPLTIPSFHPFPQSPPFTVPALLFLHPHGLSPTSRPSQALISPQPPRKRPYLNRHILSPHDRRPFPKKIPQTRGCPVLHLGVISASRLIPNSLPDSPHLYTYTRGRAPHPR